MSSKVKHLIGSVINGLQAKFPPNRIVALLTPVVFVPVAAFVAAWVPKHFPGAPTFSADQLLASATTGAVSALAIAYKWIDGWQKHEGYVADPDKDPISSGSPLGLDSDAYLSQPADIHESDITAGCEDCPEPPKPAAKRKGKK